MRDESFDEYRALSASDAAPAEIRRLAARIDRRSADALAVIASARAEHAEWVRANVSAASQVASARERLAQLRASMGDPAALVGELSARFAEEEWRDASRAAHAAAAAADEASRLLAKMQSDPLDERMTRLERRADTIVALLQQLLDAVRPQSTPPAASSSQPPAAQPPATPSGKKQVKP